MFATKVVILLATSLVIVNAMPSDNVALGGVSPVTDLKSAEEELNHSLAKLAAGDGPHYKLGKVYSATRQTVAGSLSKIVADIVDKDGNTKKCNISIWSRTWLPNGIEVTFECEGEPKLVKKHSA